MAHNTGTLAQLFKALGRISNLAQLHTELQRSKSAWFFYMQTGASNWVILSNDDDNRFHIEIDTDNGRFLNKVTMFDRFTNRTVTTRQNLGGKGFKELRQYMTDVKLNLC